MVKNKNGYKLVSALTRGFWGIDGAYAQGNFSLVQSILKGTHVFADDAPDDDVIIDTDNDDQEETIIADSFTGKIAVMSVNGPILHYGGMCSYGSKEYAARLREYADDPTIAACIMVSDSPGGQVEGTQTFADAVDYFKSKKPLLGFVDDGVAASAMYWILSGVTEIYCSHPTCRVGSIGAMASILDARKAMKDNGLNQIVVYAPQSKDKNKEYNDALKGDTKALQDNLKFICDAFINRVADNREGKLTSQEWNSGNMFFAEQAMTIGLIDGIKSFEDVVKRASELATQNQSSTSATTTTSLNNNNQNTMGIFGSDFPVLNALKEQPAATISAEQITAVNAELVAKGLTNLVMISKDHVTEANLNADVVSSVLALANTALGEGKKANLTEAVAALIADRDAHSARADAYGALPGEKPTNPTTPKKEEGGEALDKNGANSFLTSVDVEMAEYNKKVNNI